MAFDYQGFFEAIFGEMTSNEGHATIWNSRRPGTRPNVDHWYDWPQDAVKMSQFCAFAQDLDLYVSPHFYGDEISGITNHLSRSVSNAQHCAAVYQDADTFDPTGYRIPPSIIVRTSDFPGKQTHWQAWWLLDGIYTSSEVAAVAKKMCYAHRDEGADISSHSANKIMRIPGSMNTKETPGSPVEATKLDYSLRYSLYEIDNAYKDIKVDTDISRKIEEALKDIPDIDELDLPDISEAYARIPPSASNVIELLKADNPSRRSEIRRRIMLDLMEAGASDPDIVALVYSSPSGNKYREDSRGVRMAWWELQRAKAFEEVKEGGSTEAIEAFDWGEIAVDNETGEIVSEEVEFHVLEDSDRLYCKQSPNNFINIYMQYVKDSLGNRYNEPYHRICALLLLCMTVGEYGRIPMGGGMSMPLALYAMILGPSSSGKSEAKNLLSNTISTWEGTDGKVLGEDIAPTTLAKTLYDIGEWPTLYTQDEGAKVIKQAQQNSYLTGLLEMFTLIYDGKVRIPARSGEHGGESQVSTSMEFFSTPENMYGALNMGLFESGFLARSLWVNGHKVNITQDTFVPRQVSDEEAATGVSSAARAITAQLRTNGDRWFSAWSETHTTRRKPYTFTNGQKEVFAAGMMKILKYCEGHKYFEMALKSSILRMGNSILRASALLAIADGDRETDKANYIRFALCEADEWVHGLLQAADHVSESDFAKACAEIVDALIKSGGEMSYSAVIRLDPNVPARIVSDRIATLRAQGKVDIVSDGGDGIQKVILRNAKSS